MSHAVMEVGAVPISFSINACRSCGSTLLHLVADLGSTPLANAFLTADQLNERELTFPLRLVFCANCTLVQITETVRPDVLFGSYLYASSYSETMLRHAQATCDKLCRERLLSDRSLVVEIASNDGYLLQFFVDRGIPVLGIEPATNIAAIAQRRGVHTRVAFFGGGLADQLAREGLSADVILGNNVLAHVPEINDFIAGVKRILKPGGIARFEFPYLGDLIRNLEFDTIYHEHIFYFSAHSIETLLRRHGLIFTDVEHLPIHGGSLAVTAALELDRKGRSRVERLLVEEHERGMDHLAFYADFGHRVTTNIRELKSLTVQLRSGGNRICAYGASAKGSTLLNTACLEAGILDYVVDRSELKQGLFTPGTRLPILPPERLTQDHPDFVLVLTWNFLEEILQQQRAYRDSGGKFIVPIPNPVIV
jgi:SAM-dependent methyltransferase